MPTLKSKGKIVLATGTEVATNPPSDRQTHEQIRDPHLRELALKKDQVVAYITLTLQRGAEASTTTFPVHSGLVTALRNCYTNNQPETFCNVLETYLHEASTHLPHTLDHKEIAGLLSRLQELFLQVSFPYVARSLLRGL